MTNFNNLHKLDKHFDYLKNKIQKDNIFIVWWCIRDLLLDIDDEPHDIDITTNQDPQTIFWKINKDNISIFKTDKFGTITIIPHNNEINKYIKISYKKWKNLQYEITPLRLEWNYQDFRHPQEIKRTNDLIKDSKRRDFTINCIYYTLSTIEPKIANSTTIKNKESIYFELEKNWFIFLENQNILIIQNHEMINQTFENSKLNNKYLQNLTKNWFKFWKKNKNTNNIWIIIDPHNGINDIIEKKLKCVWLPDDRFGEDALRIIRAVRLVNIINQKIAKKYNEENNYFDFEKATWNSMKQNYYLVQYIAKERIKDEIIKAFKWNNPFGFISIIDELNLLKFLFPALYHTKLAVQPIRYHPFDVYTHTLLCLHNIQEINKNYLVKLWILYHDVGKPDQYYFISTATTLEERKKVHWSILHHPILWEELAQKDFKQLWFSNKEVDEIWFYVKYHMLPGELLKANPENLPKKIRKLLSEHWYKKLINLIDVCLADRLWHYNPLQPPAIKSVKNLKLFIKKIYNETGEFKLNNLSINWNDLIKKFKIKPWPIIWKLLWKALEWVIDDIKNRNIKSKIYKYLESSIK